MTERIYIDIAPDEMSATLGVRPGLAMDADELRRVLTARGIVYGINDDRLSFLAARIHDPAFESQPVQIAQGTAPQNARDVSFQPQFDVGIQSGHVDTDGAFDFRDRGLLKSVVASTLIARMLPPVQGTNGRTVRDNDLPYAATPARAKPNLGPSVGINAQGEITASIDGVILYREGELLDVTSIYEHPGNVDIHSGNLNMKGTLAVGGDVGARFHVEATGDIEIKKSILGGSVYAGNNLIVHGGVTGNGGGMVAAESAITMQHAQVALLRCRGTVEVQRGAVSCDIHGHTVRIDGPAQGGTIRAEHHIVVKDAGGRLGTTTTLCAGIPMVSNVREQFDRHIQQEQLASRMGGQLLRHHGRSGTSRSSTNDSQDASPAYTHGLRELGPRAHIDVHGTAHSGTVVQIGTRTITLDRAVSHTRFYLDPESLEIRRLPLP